MLPGGGFRIARVLGIDVYINPTWLIIFVLVGFSLGETLRTPLPGLPVFPDGVWPWVFGFGTAIIFFICLLAHELSHSLVARSKGIQIKRITLFVFGGVAEMSDDVKDSTSELLMALAGPVTTFVLAGVFYVLYRVADIGHPQTSYWVTPLFLLFSINLVVGIFNLLPGFPLDGGRVFRAALWKITGNLRKATRVASYGGQVVALGMAAYGFYLVLTGGVFGGIWLILIAAFVFQLSRSSYQQTLFQIAVADTRVKDLMYTNIPSVPEATSLNDLRNHYFGVYHLPVFPVVDEVGKLTGVVSRDDLVATNHSEWDVLSAGRISHPVDESQIINQEERLDRVMRRVMRSDQYMLVMDDGHVEGILTTDEMMRYIKARVNSGNPPA